MEIPTLSTGNISLRAIDERDIAALFSLFSHEKVVRFMDIGRFVNVSEAAQLIAFFRDKLASGEGMRWAITINGHNELIGTCGFHHINRIHYKMELGYDLLPSYWGKGIMTNSIHRLMQYGFEDLQMNRIEAFVDPANIHSRQLLERLGFEREGKVRQAFFQKGKFVDAFIYSLLQRDYRYDMQF
ncbi:GNAT family N-acetyltransferase [Chitinophaga filiformis]|uniref:GNAT family N-acetyltransferase n=1 Tax=Chitinophaga filiformis TaxID=104663 RepID=UPI001F248536|nr:GNAT family protein [Chitinophaga filiformis]MCF6406282.1 GNAT family N-acetyltransferase [Chitinophaga filiformis]